MPQAAKGSNVAPIVIETTKTTTLDEVLSRREAQRVVYVGETHASLSDHDLQLQVLKSMHRQGGKLVVGVEWFQRRFQPVLDRYIAAEIDEPGLLREGEYFERWGFDYRLYREILQFARNNGIRVLALNAERELTDAIREQGLDGLAEDVRSRLPASYDFDNGSYAQHLQDIFKLHEGRFANSPGAFQRFLEVQLTWDETMAETVARHLESDPAARVLVLAGRGHTHRAAIPQRVTRRTDIAGISIASYQPGATFQKPDFMVLQVERRLPPQGLMGVELKERDGGVYITRIAEGSKAGEAGIEAGDRIDAIQEQPITTYVDIKLAMMDLAPGQVINVKVHRESLFGLGRDIETEVPLVGRRRAH